MRRAFCFTLLPMNPGAKFVMLAPIVPLGIIGIVFFKPPWTPLRVSGLILLMLGFALLTWGRITLGNSFSVAPVAKVLVTGGPYSKIRHPVYVFGILMIAGIFMYINFPWALLILLLLIPVQIRRARAEEQVLADKFGETYTEYKRRTWL